MAVPVPANAMLVFLIFVLSILARILYRITLHPLAKFPGPRVAAVTRLSAASYDIPASDSLVKHLAGLHDKYGLLVPARPNELHIRDWDA